MPWGDYGSILLTGMTGHQPRKDGLLQLERTGPFAPPIAHSWPGFVVTDEFRKKLENSGLTGFSFKPVIKKHIVRLEWEKWDKNAPDPEFYPEEGEPENYILELPHSPELAEEMEDFWELCTEERADVERVEDPKAMFGVEIYVLLSTWDGTDFFSARTVGYVYVSEKAKNWLEREASEWLEFEEAYTK